MLSSAGSPLHSLSVWLILVKLSYSPLKTYRWPTESWGVMYKRSSIKATRASSAADKSLDLLDYQAGELILNQDMLNSCSLGGYRCKLCTHVCLCKIIWTSQRLNHWYVESLNTPAWCHKVLVSNELWLLQGGRTYSRVCRLCVARWNASLALLWTTKIFCSVKIDNIVQLNLTFPCVVINISMSHNAIQCESELCSNASCCSMLQQMKLS